VVDVYIGGTALVKGDVVQPLDVNAGDPNDPTSKMTLVWAKDGTTVNVTGGEVMSLMAGFNVLTPGYMQGLDGIASQLASTVNTIHATGVDLYGNDPTQAVDSLNFFTGTSAAAIKVNSVLANDPNRLRAGSVANGPMDGTVAQQIAAAGDAVDDKYRTFVVQLGVDVQAINRRVDSQSVITSDIDAARKSASGVSLDEEMTNMLAFQRAYEAASRLLTAVDSALDTLVNHTGTVGII
jgi:flagellar hook-associated protein 1 FlgK